MQPASPDISLAPIDSIATHHLAAERSVVPVGAHDPINSSAQTAPAMALGSLPIGADQLAALLGQRLSLCQSLSTHIRAPEGRQGELSESGMRVLDFAGSLELVGDELVGELELEGGLELARDLELVG